MKLGVEQLKGEIKVIKSRLTDLEKINYIEITDMKNLTISKQQLELLLNSVKESITKSVNLKAYSDSKEFEEKFGNDLEEYKNLEAIIIELIDS